MQITGKIQTFIFGLAFGWGCMPCLAEDVSLPFLDSFCEALKVERTAHSDHLLLDGGATIEGEFIADALSIDGRDLVVADIAAIQSGPVTRAVRVFLRDGSVLRGLLLWKAARFESETLGTITLKADHPGQIVMRRADHDGRLSGNPVAWMADGTQGQVLPVMKPPEHPLRCLWLGGEMVLAWSDIRSIRAMPAPTLEHEVQLMDGSRVRGWLNLTDAVLPMTECAALAGSSSSLMALLEGRIPELSSITGASVQIQDCTAIAGELGQPSLSWQTKDGVVTMKAPDVVNFRRLPGGDASALGAVFEITTQQGSKHIGRPRDVALLWKRGAEVLRLPWPWIQSLQHSRKEPAPKS